ncbi:MAG: hypothetical protein KDD76_05270 [Rickettsiales bacterium]|nr:hypothetical protein [Rickettsiales bacterium]
MITIREIQSAVEQSPITTWLKNARKSQKSLKKVRYNYLLSAYRRTNNPYFLWDVWILARKEGFPLPEECETLLDDMASRMSKLEPSDWIKRAANIMGLVKGTGGRSGGEEEYRKYSRNLEMAIAVEKQIRYLTTEKSHTIGVRKSAFEEVAEQFGVTVATVGKAYDEIRQHWPTY